MARYHVLVISQIFFSLSQTNNVHTHDTHTFTYDQNHVEMFMVQHEIFGVFHQFLALFALKPTWNVFCLDVLQGKRVKKRKKKTESASPKIATKVSVHIHMSQYECLNLRFVSFFFLSFLIKVLFVSAVNFAFHLVFKCMLCWLSF